MSKKVSIKLKLLLMAGGTIFVCLAAMGVASYLMSRSIVLDLIDQEVQGKVTSTADQIEQTFYNELKQKAEAAGLFVEVLVEDYYNGEMTYDELVAREENFLLDDRFGKIGDTGYIYLLSYDGQIRLHPTDVGQDYSTKSFYEDLINEEKQFISYEYINSYGETKNKLAGVYHIPDLDRIVVATVPEEEMDIVITDKDLQSIIDELTLSGVYAYFFEKDGVIYVHPDENLIGEDIDDFELHFGDQNDILASALPESGKISYFFDPDLLTSIDVSGLNLESGQKNIFFQWIDPIQSYVAIGVDEAELLAPVFQLRNIILLIAVIAIGVAMTMIVFFSNSLEKSIYQVLGKLQNIASGTEKANLADCLEVDCNDEVGEIADGVNELMFKLNRDMLNVRGASDKLDIASGKLMEVVSTDVKRNIETISANAEQVSRSVDETTASTEQANATIEEIVRNISNVNANIEKQVTAVEESASAMEEMSRNIQNVTETANETKDISDELNQTAMEGGNAVKEAMESVLEVAEFSNQILEMLKLITDIANQTNLLAMNASIEAAHAGEAGKGFAIVADEIRRLSENTNKNAGEIGDVVTSIVERIEQSVKLSQRASDGLGRILSSSQSASDKISSLNTTMEEQNYTSKEILSSIQEIVRITEEIKLAMDEQNRGIAEFSEAVGNLRDNAQLNKTAMREHMHSLSELINSVEIIREISSETSNLSGNLGELLDRFILDENKAGMEGGEEMTAMQLVE